MKENRYPQWPRGLRRTLAAEYIGVSLPLFDTMVRDGRMPKPKRVENRTIWDRVAVDRAFDLLDGGAPRDESGEEVFEIDTRPYSEWPIVARPLPTLQERALAHMYEFRSGPFFADGCGPKTYAALANLGLAEIIGEVIPGKMPAYRLTKLGIEKGEYLKSIGR
jgi:predicted DNA-binding transcriptional regulator AlpA